MGDIGATHARFALVEPDGTMTRMRAFPCADYATVADALEAYLGEVDGAEPAQAVLAVAASPMGDKVALTNSPLDVLD